MDRGKMLAGDPSATWQLILDPYADVPMPADLDGAAPPPTGAPGIFLSIKTSGMVIYRMKVDFDTPANTVKTQALVPGAHYSSVCPTNSFCIPQPGTSQTVNSLGGPAYRAAYRNFVDHESMVIGTFGRPCCGRSRLRRALV
jgi:hypothetical protein